MASSSNPSSVPTRRARYDVFLSFRGEDTRYQFVDHLFDTIDRSGMEVFKDNLNLARGEEISPQLLKAIEESRCAVVIFSKNYADSSWCLVELAKIMERHNRKDIYVLPVFYHVAPSLLRGLKGKFGTAFLEHEVRFSDKVQEWREALSAAGKLSGHHITKGDKKGEVQFIKEIVEDILKNIPRDSLEKDKIGINSDINKLVSILDIESTQEVRTLGIWGMGGVGKTIIARALFKRVRHKFEGSSFVSDVRTKSKKDICSLQKQILKDTKTHPKEVEVPDKEIGAEFIQKRLCMMKVLLVLDDVDNPDQLEFLAAEKEWFGAGSRIILTTRDKQVLTLANTNDKFKHTPLSTNEALNLFCIHAFQQSSPPNEYVVLSDDAINYCGGLPLALKVLGCHFRGRNVAEWKSSLSRLGDARDMEMCIYETLKISFDGLKDSEKEIFLDIACFLISICKLKNLKSLNLSLCTDLQKLPRRLGSMRNLENLHVGVLFPARINSPTWTTVCGLKNLSLKGRQIKDKDLQDNLTTLSSLESLNLGGNLELIQLSDSISHLRNLKRLELSKCDNLRSIGALRSGIEVLDAPYCNAVEHIEDLTLGYERLYKIDIADCEKLLQDQEMKGRVEKILQESFFMRHIIKDREFRFDFPGSKIPSWFREQQEGCEVTLQPPPKSHTVIGFAACAVFPEVLSVVSVFGISICFEIGNHEKLIHKSEVDYEDQYSTTTIHEKMWITYIPYNFLKQKMADDFGGGNWSLSIEGGFRIRVNEGVIHCGACMVYKEDIESLQPVRWDYYEETGFVYREGGSLRYFDHSF